IPVSVEVRVSGQGLRLVVQVLCFDPGLGLSWYSGPGLVLVQILVTISIMFQGPDNILVQ
uniref:Uncharacterized protein n=1 Tax=Cannabis sativa TaxID=3483 RepID=A0A803PKS5_CANSA